MNAIRRLFKGSNARGVYLWFNSLAGTLLPAWARNKLFYTVVVLGAGFLGGCLLALLNKFGSTLWVWLTVAGVASFELGAYFGWFEAGYYLRLSWKEPERKKATEYRDLSLHVGMRSVVFLTAGIGFFTLALLFKAD